MMMILMQVYHIWKQFQYLIEHNEAMKQIRSSIDGGILKKFSCSNTSLLVKNTYKKNKTKF